MCISNQPVGSHKTEEKEKIGEVCDRITISSEIKICDIPLRPPLNALVNYSCFLESPNELFLWAP